MKDPIRRRKLQHLEVIQSDAATDRRKYHFDAISLRHRAMPELDYAAVDPSIEFMGKRLSFPLLISSMTGGDDELLRRVNRNLATAAEHSGIAMGVGSQRIMLEHPEARESFALRRYAPTALLFANLGAVQLNYGYGLEHCRRAVEALDADGLYLHLNPLQELIQPEGDTNFAGLAEKIAPIARDLGKPVILKEVGAGLGPDEARLALGSGVRYLDVAGAGGTSWSRIEHHRHPEAMDDGPGLLFQDWGIPTPRALMQLSPLRDRLTLIASGGLRNGVDMVKSMILGGSLCGLAAPFLQPAMDSVEAVLALIERLRREFTMTMFLLGIERAELLVGNDALLLT